MTLGTGALRSIDSLASPHISPAPPTPPTPPGGAEAAAIVPSAGIPTPEVPPAESMLEVFHNHIAIVVVAFLVTLLATPLMRRLAVRHGIIDHPSEARKVHKIPIAYLGGLAVFAGLMGGVLFSFLVPLASARFPDLEMISPHPSKFEQDIAPLAVIIVGMTIIMITGLIDDVASLSPRLKIAGQLFAAAMIAMQDFGTKMAAGLLKPIGALLGNEQLVFRVPLPVEVPFLLGQNNTLDLIYWAGVVIIALFILGACNASNLIDGLDGLCSGVTAIASLGLLVLALGLAVADDGPRDAIRLVLCLSLFGACLGFLPHNFNPATIFLGDAGSLLLGFVTIVIVLSLGDTGKTHLVVAGLIIYAIPIMDTVLAMVRRKMAGRPLSAPDDQHLHHQLKRALGVKGAVFSLYGIGLVFAALGVWLSMGRVRVVMTIALIIASFIAVIAVKIARRQAIESAARAVGLAEPMVDRLKLTDKVIATVAEGCEQLAAMPAPMPAPRVGNAADAEAAIAAGLFLFTRWFWRFALRYYTSASS